MYNQRQKRTSGRFQRPLFLIDRTQFVDFHNLWTSTIRRILPQFVDVKNKFRSICININDEIFRIQSIQLVPTKTDCGYSKCLNIERKVSAVLSQNLKMPTKTSYYCSNEFINGKYHFGFVENIVSLQLFPVEKFGIHSH